MQQEKIVQRHPSFCFYARIIILDNDVSFKDHFNENVTAGLLRNNKTLLSSGVKKLPLLCNDNYKRVYSVLQRKHLSHSLSLQL